MAHHGGDWPPALRYVRVLTRSELASQAFGACNDSNRLAVSNELKALIFQAVQDGSLHTKDWRRVRLASLEPKGKRRAGDRSSIVSPMGHVNEEAARREKRQRRFEAEQAAFEREQAADMHSALASTSLAGRLLGTSVDQAPPCSPGMTPDPNVVDWDEYTVVGTSTKLEKPYLRLTSAPDPKTVRPLATLRQTLALLKRKWAEDGNYAYICDQLKSVRQDLTVQRIKNEFTVQVYELHARIALERGDLGEYNQCQSQLRTLYALGLPGAVHEFLAYRILYLLHTRHQRDVHALMAEMSPQDKQEPGVRHALQVRAAMRAGNYAAFFQLYETAPRMNARVMDHFVDRERVQALLILARSMRPSCALAFVTEQLGWDSVAQADQFLQSLGAAVYVDGYSNLEDAQWDTKNAQEALTKAADKFRRVDIPAASTFLMAEAGAAPWQGQGPPVHARPPVESLRPRHMVVLCGVRALTHIVDRQRQVDVYAAVNVWPGVRVWSLTQTWTRCNQDEMGSRKNVEAAVRAELLAGHSVLVDRTNIDERQRADWLLLARELRESIPIRTSLIVFDVPTSVCRARLAQRTNHPTIPTPEQAFRILALFDRSFVRPSETRPEGFDRMIVLTSMPALWSPASLLDVWDRLEQAPCLARAGDVVYANLPRQRPGRAPHARGRGRDRGHGRGRGRRVAPGTWVPPTGRLRGASAAAPAPSPPNPPRPGA